MASDDEDMGGRVSGEDVALPKATVNKFANELASTLGVRLALESRELLVQVCTEFVQLLSSEANEVCEKDSKKTITAEHVLRALQSLGLDSTYCISKEVFRMLFCCCFVSSFSTILTNFGRACHCLC